jgi:hypothetical protein
MHYSYRLQGKFISNIHYSYRLQGKFIFYWMPFWATFAREEAFFVTVASDYPASLGLYLFLSA